MVANLFQWKEALVWNSLGRALQYVARFVKWFWDFGFNFWNTASECNLAMMKTLKPHGATPSPINRLPPPNTKERFGIMRPIARKASTATLCLDLLSEKERLCDNTHYYEEDVEFVHQLVLFPSRASNHLVTLKASADVHLTQVNRFDLFGCIAQTVFFCRGFKDKKSAWARVVSSRAVGSQMRGCFRNKDEDGFKYASC